MNRWREAALRFSWPPPQQPATHRATRRPRRNRILWGLALALVCAGTASCHRADRQPGARAEVLFWHFWGGADRDVVDRVVSRFNASQSAYTVRAVAMPGNNLDLKLFLAVTGGDPPDLVNQDDPIVADWGMRGALTPLDQLATPGELQQLESWLLPAAGRFGSFNGRRYALCNGLDVRALYFNKTLLTQAGFQPPQTLDDLDSIARALTLRDRNGSISRFGYLPDPRRLWAWGQVFGGSFYDPHSAQVSADSAEIVRALEWMTTYREMYGAAEVAAFRQGDQSLPGKTFPLLANRYAMIMDGQWRVRDIRAAQQEERLAGKPVTEYGVCALPPPPGGRQDAGWVNGNFFLVPRGARQPAGAWEFMKFWCGFDGHAATAAETCISGGWIPVSEQVVSQSNFQQHLAREPLFAEFVRLAASPHQVPTPVIPGAAFFQREINRAAATALYVENAAAADALLQRAAADVQAHLDSMNDRDGQ